MTAADLHELAQVKRLLELVEGDPDFRRRARADPSQRQALLDAARIDLRTSEIGPFWGLLHQGDAFPSETKERSEEVAQHALGTLWNEWVREQAENARQAATGWTPSGQARLSAWRLRRIARARSESLKTTDQMLFPLLTFELSKGCSTQCWFCALDPPALQGSFAYTGENRRLWRDTLAAAWDLFGSGCRTALCYHATEPTDNADYFDFLEDFHGVMGIYPQTTTARPLRDLTWTRRLPRLRGVSDWPHDRFTVLSLATLREIHRTFTARELLHVDLVFQNPGALSYKVRAGRALARPDRVDAEERDEGEGNRRGLLQRRETIECTCGYLVNMVDRSIQLVSPSRVSVERPRGYAVHAEGTFHDADSFRAFIEGSIETMRSSPGRDERLSFRDDLTFETLSDGFVLTSRYRRHVVRGHASLTLIGALVQSGAHTPAEVAEGAIGEGMGVLDAIGWLERLYQHGLLASS